MSSKLRSSAALRSRPRASRVPRERARAPLPPIDSNRADRLGLSGSAASTRLLRFDTAFLLLGSALDSSRVHRFGTRTTR